MQKAPTDIMLIKQNHNYNNKNHNINQHPINPSTLNYGTWYFKHYLSFVTKKKKKGCFAGQSE